MGRSLRDQLRRIWKLFRPRSDSPGRGFVPLAESLRRSGRLQEAEQVVRAGLEAHPGYAPGHVVAGRIHLATGAQGDAEEAFHRALSFDPHNPEALRSLSRIFLDRGESDRFLEISRRLLEEEPWNGSLMRRMEEMEVGEPPPSGDAAEEDRTEEGEGTFDEEDDDLLMWENATLQADESRIREGPASGVVPEREGTEPVPEPWERVEEDGSGEVPSWAVGDEVEVTMEPRGGGVLVTRTLGEVYLRQGLLEKARDVFQELLIRDPGNEELRRRLMEVGERAAAGAARPVIPIQDLSPEGVVPVEALAPTSPVPADPTPSPSIVPVDALAPDELQEDLPWEVVPIEFLAPPSSARPESEEVGEVVLIESLAPAEVVSIESLAPDAPAGDGGREEAPGQERRILEEFKDWLDNLP